MNEGGGRRVSVGVNQCEEDLTPPASLKDGRDCEPRNEGSLKRKWIIPAQELPEKNAALRHLSFASKTILDFWSPEL